MQVQHDHGTKMSLIREEPPYEKHEFFPRRTKYAFVTVTLNEGERIRSQLKRMNVRAELADIIVADGRSKDDSLDHEYLQQCGVRALLITDEPGLSTATRMALAYVIDEGYEGVITVDGNGKDGVDALPDFIRALDEGYDLVQGSRFMKGGSHARTPMERHLAIFLIMRPLIALGCGFFYTDPTNAFRALSRRFLLDPRVQPLRKEFVRFNGQLYLIYSAARLGFKVKDIPVTRVYPEDGSVPTKITSWKHKYQNLRDAVLVACGKHNLSP
ncbi:MAG: glycosyltransferase family 2 protein [Cyanobacteria bacterium]|nr:glycosyltransferase family 2 protein [Cyanobacteriota bacterium]